MDVRTLLGADASYLVLRTFNEDATDFARSLDVDVMTVKQLEIWESALNITEQHWPSRSDFRLIDPIRLNARNLGKQKDASEVAKVMRNATQFVEIDSWRVFGYGKLNHLFRILKSLSEVHDQLAPKEEERLYARYSASALLVRLSQFLLAMCLDISRVPISDVQSYLLSRLTYGNQDPDSVRGLLNSTVGWVSHALRERGMALPPEADLNRLYRPPLYSEGLIALIQTLLSAPNEARYLPIAVEIEQFGKEEDTNLLPRLRSAWRAGHHLAALVRAFATASLGVSASLLKPLREDPVTFRPARQEDGKEDAKSSPRQNKLLA